MRKIWCSPNTLPIWSLSCLAESRSRPIGFSTTMREFSSDDVMLLEFCRDASEQGRGHREIEGADRLAVADCLLEIVEAGAGRGVGRDIAQPLDEGIDLLFVQIFLGNVFVQRLAGEIPELLVRQLGARGADDARRLGELMVNLAMVEGGQELAFGEVARASGMIRSNGSTGMIWLVMFCPLHAAMQQSNLIDLIRPAPQIAPRCQPGQHDRLTQPLARTGLRWHP